LIFVSTDCQKGIKEFLGKKKERVEKSWKKGEEFLFFSFSGIE